MNWRLEIGDGALDWRVMGLVANSLSICLDALVANG